MKALMFERKALAKALVLCGAVAVTLPIVLTCPADAKCLAQALPKLSLNDYKKLGAWHYNNAVMADLVVGPGPCTGCAYDYRADMQKIVQKRLSNFYDSTYDPRHIICVSTSEDEYTGDINIPTYSGRKLILSAMKHGIRSAPDEVFGPNLAVLRDAYHDVLSYLNAMINKQRCGGDKNGICQNVLKYLQNYKDKLTDIELEFIAEENQDIAQYSMLTDESTVDTNSMLGFYDAAASQSYINLIQGVAKKIQIARGSMIITVPALTFDPITSTLSPNISFLDFVVARLIKESVGSSRVDLQACKLEYSIVSPK